MTLRTTLSAIGLISVPAMLACGSARMKEETQSQVNRLADELDVKTTTSGSFVHQDPAAIVEKDSWGHLLTVAYSQGGMAESLTVRSFGPDGESNTPDDIIAKRQKITLKGVGVGIRDNIGKAAAEGAKGAVIGLRDGIRELKNDRMTTETK